MISLASVAIALALFIVFRPFRKSALNASSHVFLAAFCLWAAVYFLNSAHVAKGPLFWSGTVLLGTLALVVALDVFLWILGQIKRAASVSPLRVFSRVPDHIKEIFDALEVMATKRVGALIVLERKDLLDPFLSGGMVYDGEIRSQVLNGFFHTSSAVHDGAVIIRNGRIKMINAILPLSTKVSLPMGVGTRHRSAIGITEKTDAVAFAVSEQRGEISIASNGAWRKVANRAELYSELKRAFSGKLRSGRFPSADAPEKIAV